MLFNSIDFAVFLPLVFLVYWLLNRFRLIHQNTFLTLASYLFYGWWDWRFLFLIIFSTAVDYTIGLQLKKAHAVRHRKFLLWTSIFVNLGFLGFFKYYNFFLENFVNAFTFLGYSFSVNSIDIVLPVGISFYTFQTLSYTIDVYNKKLEPTRDFIAFSAFVSFFPQLVAGPIERATNLLPQFYKRRSFDYSAAVDGARQVLWGFFKKVVVADNCADFANLIFNNSDSYPGSVLFVGAVFFAFQIYGDFSGYSDIAIGVARIFGFRLMKNFAFPYFSRDIAEFWRRWHISLSTWFRDYVYIPLGGSKGGVSMQIRNTLIIFIVSGFWHGANWTFIAWGAINALYFVPLLLLNKNRKNLDVVGEGSWFPGWINLLKIGLTFGITCLAWIFFRAENITHAMQIFGEIFSSSLLVPVSGIHFVEASVHPAWIVGILAVFLPFEWFGRHNEFALERWALSYPKVVRWGGYLFITIAVFLFSGKEQEFIYFQF